MADHHDMLDSALDLLRSRQWAGSATNPVLEKQFMHQAHQARGLNHRLILGIAGALIGCGAVAAATSPAWRSAIFGSAPEIRRAVVAAPPARPPVPARSFIPDRAPVVPALARAESVAAPSLHTDRAAAAAPEATVNVGQPVTAVTSDDDIQHLRDSDPRAFYQRALSAYLERCSAGDAPGCADVARSVRGEPTSTRWWERKALARVDLSEVLARAYAVEADRAKLELRYTVLDKIASEAQLELDMALEAAQPGGWKLEAGQVLILDSGELNATVQADGTAQSATYVFRLAPQPEPKPHR